MAQLQQQLRRLEAERDRLRDTLASSREKIPSSKACESLVEFVNKHSKEDPLLPTFEGSNSWTDTRKTTPDGRGGCECVIA